LPGYPRDQRPPPPCAPSLAEHKRCDLQVGQRGRPLLSFAASGPGPARPPATCCANGPAQFQAFRTPGRNNPGAHRRRPRSSPTRIETEAVDYRYAHLDGARPFSMRARSPCRWRIEAGLPCRVARDPRSAFSPGIDLKETPGRRARLPSRSTLAPASSTTSATPARPIQRGARRPCSTARHSLAAQCLRHFPRAELQFNQGGKRPMAEKRLPTKTEKANPSWPRPTAPRSA